MLAANAGIIETGDNSVGVRMNGVREDVRLQRQRVRAGSGCSVYLLHRRTYSGTADVIGTAYLMNSGTISVGANSTAVEITGAAANEQGLHLFNTGTIDGRAGRVHGASASTPSNNLGSYVVNVGTIAGDIVFGDGDDRLMNTQFLDSFGQLVSTGNIVMNGSTIDFGAGVNRFDNDRGVITIVGGDNLITGADLFMTQAQHRGAQQRRRQHV